MTLLRLLFAALVLSAQAWPASAAQRGDTAEKCGMSCCAALAAAEANVCGCLESSQPAEPSSLPPANSRELMTQVVWVASHETGLVERPQRSLNEAPVRFGEDAWRKQPHVRLPVLFCSLLN